MAKGIVIVHGMGEQEPGDCLVSLVNPLADYLEKELADVKVMRHTRIGGKDQTPQAQLDITKNGKPYTKWIFREVWWAEAFKPPSMWSVLFWVIRQAPAQLSIMVEGIRAEREEPRGRTESRRRLVKSWTREISHVYHSFVDILIELLPIAAIPLVFLSGPLILVFTLLRVVPAFEWLSELLLGLVERILVGSLGDPKRYIDHGVWAANVRCKFDRVLSCMLDTEEIDDVTVIAHSWGTVIAYEALSERYDIDWTGKKPVKLVTVGAGLNRVPAMVRRSRSPHARERFGRVCAEGIEWLNIYTKYDPASCGQLRSGGIFNLKEGIKQKSVTNFDSPFSDHVNYWNNSAHVIPLLVRMIEGKKELLPEDDPTLLPDRDAREKAKKRWNRRIHLASLFRLVFVYVSFAAALFLAISHAPDVAIVEWLSGWPFLMERAGDVMEFFLRSRAWTIFGGWLIGTVAASAISFGIYTLLWRWLRPDTHRKKRSAGISP